MAQEFQSLPPLQPQIQEGREFTNPIVRFRRIRGRVVPIYNRKRIGKEITGASTKVIAAGAAIGIYGLGKRMIGPALKKIPPHMKEFSLGKLSLTRPKSVAKALTIASAPLRLAFRRPLGVAATLAGFGIAGVQAGTYLEATSPLGLDIGAE